MYQQNARGQFRFIGIQVGGWREATGRTTAGGLRGPGLGAAEGTEDKPEAKVGVVR